MKEFEALMQTLKLINIIIPKMDFSLGKGCDLPIKTYQMHVGRSAGNVRVTEKQLCVGVGFEAKGFKQKKDIFTCHYHFLVIYSHEDKASVEKYLENEEVKKLLLGAQTDKLVWSYLRRALLQTIVDAGLPPITLPLNR
jgi:preprotein translocase subunit SecB